MPKVTVLVPTHDHGQTLAHSVASACAQTLADLEILVVGDGVPEDVRSLVGRLAAADDRIRFFDYRKGARRGELYRHAALGQATGEVVFYLNDRDLWFPDHVERMMAHLAHADFVHAMPVMVHASGEIDAVGVDLDRVDVYRDRLRTGINSVAPSAVAHTMRSYRSLPFGWRTTPDHLPTDMYMWQQFLEHGAVMHSSMEVTVIAFPTVFGRESWTPSERAKELQLWTPRVSDPAWRRRILEGAVADLARDGARFAEHADWCNRRIAELERELSETRHGP